MADLDQATIEPIELDRVIIRFAGDSGDGMQITGAQFTTATALMGNDLATFPDFPAEIRAPTGTTYGVSGFQIHFSSQDIHTPADRPDVQRLFHELGTDLGVAFQFVHGGRTRLLDAVADQPEQNRFALFQQRFLPTDFRWVLGPRLRNQAPGPAC